VDSCLMERVSRSFGIDRIEVNRNCARPEFCVLRPLISSLLVRFAAVVASCRAAAIAPL
jgi:hypothetical protein